MDIFEKDQMKQEGEKSDWCEYKYIWWVDSCLRFHTVKGFLRAEREWNERKGNEGGF